MKTGSMVIVPFKPEHLDTFRPGDREKVLWPLPNPSALVGKTYSAMEDGKCFGIGGVFDGNASLLLSDEFRSRPFTLHRMAKKALRSFCSLRATVPVGRMGDSYWLHLLGFEFKERIGDMMVFEYERH